ncbi:MAG: uracil-DNA glycosylase [Myxococcota bacterium]
MLSTVLHQLAALLRYQGELGLRAIPGSQERLIARPVAGSQVRARNGDPGVLAQSSAPVATTSLHQVHEALGDCRRCKLHSGRTNIVFGVGDERARLMFVGEGPGRDEDLQGEPFVGAAGQLLDKMIEAMGLGRQQVYIANIVKCRPPRNRDPEPDEVLACEPFLKAQIRAVRPDVVVALGRYAAQTLLADTTAISRLRGHWREYEGIALMPTFHPAYLLRNPSDKRAVWADLKQVMARLGLTAPASSKAERAQKV